MQYNGSCHCGNVKFELEGQIDGALMCNCSICQRKGARMAFFPRSALTLLTPEDKLASYTFNKHVIHHRFCPACGIHTYGEGVDEAAQAFGVDPAVAVGDDFQRNLVHARRAVRRAFRQARQLLAVILRQVAPRGADLFFDQVGVIQQPLGSGRDLARVLDGVGQLVASLGYHLGVLGQARQQAVRAAALAQFMGLGQRLAVGRHLLRAEQFRT
eukprot:gene38210-47174_t